MVISHIQLLQGFQQLRRGSNQTDRHFDLSPVHVHEYVLDGERDNHHVIRVQAGQGQILCCHVPSRSLRCAHWHVPPCLCGEPLASTLALQSLQPCQPG